ncbi:hypothetical protein T12_6647 [Trichinella patagoniensis]|uniref:Uncharacterized protein n=1 Tax=Trichinella patagoniensis TaxID=990121 RepID=A0A0V0XRI0_9BILA|nr:hypothetical protein T12_6647 [Trichinella patagoniensis]
MTGYVGTQLVIVWRVVWSLIGGHAGPQAGGLSARQ